MSLMIQLENLIERLLRESTVWKYSDRLYAYIKDFSDMEKVPDLLAALYRGEKRGLSSMPKSIRRISKDSARPEFWEEVVELMRRSSDFDSVKVSFESEDYLVDVVIYADKLTVIVSDLFEADAGENREALNIFLTKYPDFR